MLDLPLDPELGFPGGEHEVLPALAQRQRIVPRDQRIEVGNFTKYRRLPEFVIHQRARLAEPRSLGGLESQFVRPLGDASRQDILHGLAEDELRPAIVDLVFGRH